MTFRLLLLLLLLGQQLLWLCHVYLLLPYERVPYGCYANRIGDLGGAGGQTGCTIRCVQKKLPLRLWLYEPYFGRCTGG
uniref:Putative secreted peptide n=1 Tax=Anopheles braziliensis TaxID=58242 RepID=A0A2M3ZQ35_9DIPT